MNKRDRVLSLAHGPSGPDVTPAAFFMHFDAEHQRGQAAVDRHLEFFRATDMDLVKVQFEQPLPQMPMRRPEDWAGAPLYPDEFFEASIGVAAGLARAARPEALVIMTLYSPLMWMAHLDREADIAAQMEERPDAVARGLEIMTENVLRLVRGCRRAGVDGFYASTQGGEAFRFRDRSLFARYVKPSDLAVWDALAGCELNILHVCDYHGGYDDLAPFVDYPGHLVNSSLEVGGRVMTAREAAELFGRPFMGGMERKGAIAGGDAGAIEAAVSGILADAPERFFLAADCTVPSETPWQSLRAAVDAAHRHGS